MANTKLNPVMRKAVIAFSVRNRRRKVVPILAFMADKGVRDVVFVGCSPGKNPNEAIVELAVAKQAKVLVACDILDCEGLPWPFVQADGRDLPFADGYTDMVLANAVIEHVGGLSDQQKFVDEQSRVARSWVITTPNRWFPVEAHTSVLFLHWSRRWREGRREFTRLLSRSEFRALLPEGAVIYGKPWSPTFTAVYPG
jgi:Methyltransferase domain